MFYQSTNLLFFIYHSIILYFVLSFVILSVVLFIYHCIYHSFYWCGKTATKKILNVILILIYNMYNLIIFIPIIIWTLFCLENVLCLLYKYAFIIATKQCLFRDSFNHFFRTKESDSLKWLSVCIITYTFWDGGDGGLYFVLWVWSTSVQGTRGWCLLLHVIMMLLEFSAVITEGLWLYKALGRESEVRQ